MNLIKQSLVAALFATAFTAPVALADSADEMTIENITASGSACHTDSSGKPIDFSVIKTTQGGKPVFRIGFDKFDIESGEQLASKNCTIYVDVAYPAGKTIHTFNTFVEGAGDVESGARATVRTSVTLPGKRPSSKRYSIRARGDDRWKSNTVSRRSSVKTRCGDRNQRIAIKIDLSLSGGKDSFVSVGGSSSQFANIDYKLKDCE